MCLGFDCFRLWRGSGAVPPPAVLPPPAAVLSPPATLAPPAVLSPPAALGSAWDRLAAHAPEKVFEFVLSGDPAVVVKVYDGDTVHLVFDYRGAPVRCRCRLVGIDAPELRRDSPRGAAARDALAALTTSARLRAWSFGVDKYGRLLVQLELPDTRSVSQVMIESGHARPYAGGTRTPW